MQPIDYAWTLLKQEYDPIHVEKLKIQQRMMANAPLCEECGGKKTYTPTQYNKYSCLRCEGNKESPEMHDPLPVEYEGGN